MVSTTKLGSKGRTPVARRSVGANLVFGWPVRLAPGRFPKWFVCEIQYFNEEQDEAGTKRSRTSVAKEKRLEAAGVTFHHSVYVILLDPAVLRHPSILRLNPNREPAKPCVWA
jgi:hypothetical protein